MKFRVLLKTRKSIVVLLIVSVALIVLGASRSIRLTPMDQLWFGITLFIWTVLSTLARWLESKWKWLYSFWAQLIFLAVIIYCFIGVLSILKKGF